MVAVGGYFRQLAERSGLSGAAARGHGSRFDGPGSVAPLERDVVVEAAASVNGATLEAAAALKPNAATALPDPVESVTVAHDAPPPVAESVRHETGNAGVLVPSQHLDDTKYGESRHRGLEVEDTLRNSEVDVPGLRADAMAEPVEATRGRDRTTTEPVGQAWMETGAHLREQAPVDERVPSPEAGHGAESPPRIINHREQVVTTSRAVEPLRMSQPRQPIPTSPAPAVELRIGSVTMEIHQPPPPAQEPSPAPVAPAPPAAPVPREQRAAFSARRHYLRMD